jgi:CRP/FNR family cyclic AMP-dependent transcriptional regulator
VGASQGETTAIRVRSSFQRSFEPGETVFDEGDTGDRLYVIQSGEVELVREGVGASRVVARVGPGDFFGELGVVLGRPCTTRAVAVRATRVLELDRETLESMCLEQPAIAIRLLRVVVSRLIEAETRLAALGVDDLLKPVVRGLVRRSEPDPTNGIRIPTSLRRLSEDAGLSMFETHRALHHLIDRKVIRLVDDCLFAADVDTLTASIDATE